MFMFIFVLKVHTVSIPSYYYRFGFFFPFSFFFTFCQNSPGQNPQEADRVPVIKSGTGILFRRGDPYLATQRGSSRSPDELGACLREGEVRSVGTIFFFFLAFYNLPSRCLLLGLG